MRFSLPRHLVWSVPALLVIVAGGCTGRARDGKRFVPSVENARQALEAALRDWQAGSQPGKVASTSPSVQVVDSHRQPGQRLASFEILGEVGGEGPRCFLVRLSLQQPAQEARARYVVVGVDPLWVFREEDFEMLTHWDHPMSEPDEKKK
jgi:hypothetical protein